MDTQHGLKCHLPEDNPRSFGMENSNAVNAVGFTGFQSNKCPKGIPEPTGRAPHAGEMKRAESRI